MSRTFFGDGYQVQLTTRENQDGLLAPDEREPVTIYNEACESPFLLVADHAGNLFPRALGYLGVSSAERERHIAWDIGIAEVARLLGAAIKAKVVQQNYSRLIIDCNRPPGSPRSIPEESEFTTVPGNVCLTQTQMAERERYIFWPYHHEITRELDYRCEIGKRAILIAMHSFTPVLRGIARPWHASVLYNRDPRFARLFLSLLRRQSGLAVGDNEPYRVTDESDFTIPVHGERRALLHVGIEVRQDLITDKTGQRQWANLLAQLLQIAQEEISADC
jgi:predicted N-formylglutamate amidohydrolase